MSNAQSGRNAAVTPLPTPGTEEESIDPFPSNDVYQQVRELTAKNSEYVLLLAHAASTISILQESVLALRSIIDTSLPSIESKQQEIEKNVLMAHPVDGVKQ